MKLAIMQPYFFPYIGYFQLISAVDLFIVADEVQYIKKGWINRNRILKQTDGWQYITAPVQKHHHKDLIKNVLITADDAWRNKILKQVGLYEKAPYFNAVFSLLQQCLLTSQRSIALFNAALLQHVAQYIGMHFKIAIQSNLALDYSEVYNKEDRPIQMCRQIGATTYINPCGGTALYEKEKFNEKGINLTFLKPHIEPYNQQRNFFEPHLSIIDVMMFHAPEEIKKMLGQYTLL